MMRKLFKLCILLGLTAGSSLPADDVPARDQALALLSQVRAMSHGVHNQSEWNEMFGRIDTLAKRVEDAGHFDERVELQRARARILSEALGRHPAARDILIGLQADERASLKARRRVCVDLADVYARLGDVAAIEKLIADYRKGPLYDPEEFTYRGGAGPGDPLVLRRSLVEGTESITITAMDTARRRAQFAGGVMAPLFEGTDRSGRRIRLSDYRGSVVLVDFWLREWIPWQRRLPQLISLHRDYRDRGFNIIGLNLDASSEGLDAFLGSRGISWPQLNEGREISRKYSVFGEAASFLVGPDGQILGRDLSAQTIRLMLDQLQTDEL